MSCITKGPARRYPWLVTIFVFLLAIPLVACSTASLPGRAAATAQLAAAAQSTASLAANPASGYAGIYVEVSGDGWPRNMMVVVALADAQGESGTLAAENTDSSGKLTTGFLYPIEERWLTPGSRTIVARSADGAVTASTAFMVTEAGASGTPASAATVAPSLTPTATLPVTTTAASTPTQLPTAEPSPTATVASVVAASGSSNEGQGNKPPVVKAALLPGAVDHDWQRFTVVATATDPDGNLDNIVAVINTPPLPADEQLKLEEKDKLEVYFGRDRVEIHAPDPQAIVEQIRQYGGIVVQDGQTIEVHVNAPPEYKIHFDDLLRIEGKPIVLHVVAVDTDGASAQAAVSPLINGNTGEGNDDHENDDHGNEHEQGDDEHDDNGNGASQGPFNKDACKKDGWRNLTRQDGSHFKNQGDCIQYANTGK